MTEADFPKKKKKKNKTAAGNRVEEIGRMNDHRSAGRATVGAPPANAGGPDGPAGAPTVAAEAL
jgi:hypothetical protein